MRLVVLRHSARSVAMHLRYIVRVGVSPEGTPGVAYDARHDQVDLEAFRARGEGDRHQFRFIVAPEDGVAIGDLRGYTRALMDGVERDLATRLDWAAVDHWDTDNPHTHLVLRGKDQSGGDLLLARDYIRHGMRRRACELATEWLGPRTDRELREAGEREVHQDRWTRLDRELAALARKGQIDLSASGAGAMEPGQRAGLIGRLQHLETMGLATRLDPGSWTLRDDAEAVLRAMGERGDIVRTMQRALGRQHGTVSVFDPRRSTSPVVGRIAGKGLADELNDRAYLIVDGVDGRAHYVRLGPQADLGELPLNGIVEVRTAPHHIADRNILGHCERGLYRPSRHLAALRASMASSDPQDIVDGHVRRLEALRRAGIVDRLAAGAWRVPEDLVERGRAYDRRRAGDVQVIVRSHLPIDNQITAIGATWLDRQRVGEVQVSVARQGFGRALGDALARRETFLVEHGFAERRDGKLVLPRNLVATLRRRELVAAAKAIAAETGLAHRPLVEGTSVAGIYRRSIQLVSGRFAMLDDGLGFTLVPWRPVLETRLGKSISAAVRGDQVTWRVGRQLGL